MSQFLSSITDRGATPALIKTMAYQQSRLKVIAENVANIGTPHYRAKHLDEAGFEGALRQAFKAREDDPAGAFEVNGGSQISTDEHGMLWVTPSEEPVGNVLFHDDTSTSIEREMSELADAGMKHDMAVDLLRGRFEGLRKAIRGRL